MLAHMAVGVFAYFGLAVDFAEAATHRVEPKSDLGYLTCAHESL